MVFPELCCSKCNHKVGLKPPKFHGGPDNQCNIFSYIVEFRRSMQHFFKNMIGIRGWNMELFADTSTSISCSATILSSHDIRLFNSKRENVLKAKDIYLERKWNEHENVVYHMSLL